MAIDELKVVLKLPLLLRQVDYNCGRLVILKINTSSIAIGWTIGQDDKEGNQFTIRFGARILIENQRAYS